MDGKRVLKNLDGDDWSDIVIDFMGNVSGHKLTEEQAYMALPYRMSGYMTAGHSKEDEWLYDKFDGAWFDALMESMADKRDAEVAARRALRQSR